MKPTPSPGPLKQRRWRWVSRRAVGSRRTPSPSRGSWSLGAEQNRGFLIPKTSKVSGYTDAGSHEARADPRLAPPYNNPEHFYMSMYNYTHNAR